MRRTEKTESSAAEIERLRRRVAELEHAHRVHVHMEAALRESEERYRQIFSQSNDAIFVLNPHTATIIDANPRACGMLGYTHDELLATSLTEIHPHEMPQLLEFARSVLQQGLGWTNELCCVTKDGEPLPAEISASTVDISGEQCIIALVRDITERKQAEETLRELAVVAERNRLAREIHDTLAQGLTAIIWQTNAAERMVECAGPEAQAYLSRVRELARESLLEARRSVWDLRASPLEGQTLSQALRGETDRAGSGRNIEASFLVTGTERVLPAGVEAGILRIGQESLANILKHAGATRLKVTLAFEDHQVRLTTQDNGTGFDPELPAHEGRQSGGFGLISMRERARLLGGDLTVQSGPGQGTLITATISLR